MDAAFQDRLQEIARRAAEAWGITSSPFRLISHRENAVFEVGLPDGTPAVLRLHRPGYMNADALRSEIAWLAALSTEGVPVPAPIPMCDGGSILVMPDQEHGSRSITMLSWVSGKPLGSSGKALPWRGEQRVSLFDALGAGMASLHVASDQWPRPPDFHRHVWDRAGLVGDRPFWGRFWEASNLSADHSRTLVHLRAEVDQALRAAPHLDYGLIHADLVRENVLVDGDALHFIDFDDAGFGWRLFDIATALLPNLDEPDAGLLAAALLRGYRRRRPLSDADLALLPLFLVIRALTYIGWFAARAEMDPTGARVQQHLTRSLALAARWRAGWNPLEDHP